ncbi:hypothetical protein J7439_22475, partial [Salinisphaera sp. G21_0]|nr:hypothetical protein [Salinisphaera sp. G21_0]
MHDNLSIDQSHPEQAIPYPLSSYFELVDWSGRITRKGNCGRITDDVPPILERLGIDPLEWLETMRWNNRFHRALASLKTYVESIGKGWVHGMAVSRGLFIYFPVFAMGLLLSVAYLPVGSPWLSSESAPCSVSTWYTGLPGRVGFPVFATELLPVAIPGCPSATGSPWLSSESVPCLVSTWYT